MALKRGWGKEPQVVTDVNNHASSVDSRAALSALRLPELQAMAAERGITGTSKLRKGDLVEAINEKNSNTETSAAASAPASTEAPVRKRASRRATSVDGAAIAGSEAPAGAPQVAKNAAPKNDSAAPAANAAPAADSAPST